MLAKFAEDDRIEQMNAQKRRMKQLEHKRAVEALIDDRRAQFAADKQRDLDIRKEEEMMERLRQQIIEEERQRLLKEHASKLLGYLPKVSGKKKKFCTFAALQERVSLRVVAVEKVFNNTCCPCGLKK